MQQKRFFLPTGLLLAVAGSGWAAVAAAQSAEAVPRASLFAVQTPRALARVDKALNAVSAIASNDVWAVGGIITHFDGNVWGLVATPPRGAQLADVAAVASNDVWAVGTAALAGGSMTLAEHWNGQAWSVIPTPPLTGQQASFSAVVALSSTDVWAAGAFIVGGANIEPLFEHWDGHAWTIVGGHVPGNHLIAKLAAVSPTDIWAVGSVGAGDQGLPFAEHWDGTLWRPVTVPVAGVGGTLTNVRALSASNVWAVGSATQAKVGGITISANPIQTLIEHWDGSAWSIVPSPNMGSASVFQANRLFGLGALSVNDIWAVGQFALPDGSTRQLALALRWNGTSWSIVPVPDVGLLSSYSGVATLGNSAVWIVGAGGFPSLISGFGPLIAYAPRG